MRIAVVRNRETSGVINRFGPVCHEKYGRSTVQAVIDALRSCGHEVRPLEGDITLLETLRGFMPPDPADGAPGGLVFNMAYGIQGEARYTHVPAMLEMAGVPYTGSSPRAHAVALDKVLTKILMERAGVPTPRSAVLRGPGDAIPDLRYPLIVKPRHESTSHGLELVRDRAGLDAAVGAIVAGFRQEALVEEYVDGREVAVAVLGNDPVEALPVVELDFGDRPLRLMTKPDKFHRTEDEPRKLCPAPLGDALTARVRGLALEVFRACECRDYARVDIRIDSSGAPHVLEINSMASLGPGGGFVTAALAAGYTYESLVGRIVDIAHERYFGRPAPRGALTTERAG